HYLLATKSSNTAQEFAEKTKQDLIDEFFLSGANSVPELEGGLYLKAEGKKSWKKHFCMLRGSGIYYCPKGKSKSLKDLVCYVQFEHIDVYNGVGWKKKYKCPSDFCFALKHPQIMQKSKYIKYLCAEDYRTTQKWITAIRIAKYGKQLHMSYKLTQKEMRDNGSNLSSLRSSDTSSMTSMQSSSSTQSSQGTASMASPASSQSSSSAIPQSSVTRSKSDKSNLMTNTSSRNTQEMSSSGSISGRSGTFSHKVGDVFANAWKIGSEMQQQQKQEDRMSVSSTLTVDSFSSESQSQSSKSSVELTSGTPQTKHPVIGVPLPGILKPSPTHHAVEPPKHANVDMDIQSQLLQLELDLEKQKTYNPTHQQISPWSSPVASKSGTDEVDGNANAITKVHVTAKDTEAVSVIVKPPTGLTKHESLKKSKPPPPPKRSADTVTTLSRSVSVGSAARGGISPLRDSQKHVQFKESPDISSSAPARPSSDERFPPPPFPVYQRYSACSTPTTPSFPAPPSPLTPGFQAGLTSPPTPNYPAPPPWIPADNESRPRAATSTDKVSNLAMNAGFLADLQKAIRGPPQNPQQETGEKKAPPPPPKRSGESATSRSSKKHPPPPPQRFT
uniref:Ras-associated and pleckstrin homology domains-containing protein 1-like n=1 Tax=Saccoglossus kowalevskii TaxID=10224 RepID=A0ABM0MVG7_SACKO